MDDLISRQELLKRTIYNPTHAPYITEQDVRSCPSAQPEQHWIPCSERLPDHKDAYWVCLDSGGQCQCRYTNDMYGLGANEFSTWGWHIMDKPQYSRVVAWMKLPTPYYMRGEQDE